jgi:tol-pal system protein YbgF
MKRFVRITIAAGVVASLAVPAQAQNREHQQMAAELRIVQERQQEQALQIEKLTMALADAIKALNTRLDASDATDVGMRKTLADEKTILDNVNTTLRAINERTSDTNARIGTLREDIGALSSAVAALGTATSVSSAPPVADGPPTAAAVPTTAPAATTTPRPSSGLTASRLWDIAWTDYTSGDFPLAIRGFETLLREYPRSDRAVEAQYYIGESNMKLRKLPEAITAYTAVTTQPNAGNRVPDAYYRIGEAQRSLGQIEAARVAWETAVRKYPDSDGGTLAKQRLDGLPPAAARP